MTNEGAWNVTVHSDNRMNRMTNIPNTGTVLAALDKTKHGIFICTADGGGLLKDHIYCCNAAGDGLIDLSSMQPHTHISDSTGGEIESIARFNPSFCDLWLIRTQDLQKANWNQVVTGTGTIEDKTDGTTAERSIRLRPNATSGSGSTISYPGFKLDWSKRSFFITKLQIETATSIALHTGVGADDVTSADTNTRKYQAEVCTVTNNNWWLRTATGSANSASDTGIAITANRVSVCIRHDPDDVSTYLLIDENTQFQKTTNIPVDNVNTNANVIKHSVKNSTAADRPLLTYGSRLGYYIKDNWKL